MTTTRDAGFFTEELSTRDPEIFGAITDELGRQRDEIELIASENIVSRAVMQAQGSVMTNKYAEGYPGRRYMAAVNTWMWQKIWRLIAPSNCSVVNSLMCSPTPVRKPTKV